MKVSASIKSNINHHQVVVQSDDVAKAIQVSPKASGYGSSVNGGELLLLSLATCFCNDLYRQACKRNITVSGVEVLLKGELIAEGEPGTNFTNSAKESSNAPDAEIQDLIASTDRVAEIHYTLRKGIPVLLQDKTQSLE